MRVKRIATIFNAKACQTISERLKVSIAFKLRPWSEDDLVTIVKYANNEKIANNLTDGFPPPYYEKDARFFLDLIQKSKDLILCIEVNGEFAGSVGIHLKKDIHRKNAEIGYWLAEPYWGQGIISRVIPEMVSKAFDQFDIERIYAPVFGRNKASQRVLEKCGFAVEGEFKNTVFKNGQFEDEVVLAIRREQWQNR